MNEKKYRIVITTFEITT